MKRILTLIGILACIGLSRSGYAQTITTVSYNDSCYGMGYTVKQAVIALSGATTACTIESNFGDGTGLDTNSVFGSGTTKYSTPTHYYYATGAYTVKHVLLCGGLRVDSVTMTVNAACTYVTGVIYHDANANCVLNSAEYSPNGLSYIEVDSAGVLIDTLSANGYWGYNIKAITATTYKFKLLNAPAGYAVSCPTSGQLTLSFTPGLTALPPQNYALSCSSTPTYDYKLFFSRSLRAASSGGSSFINLYAYNSTCHSGTGTVTLQVSPKYNITVSGITPTPTSVSGNTVTWTIANMVVNSYHSMHVPLTPKSTTANGDTACTYAVITPLSDANPANNVISVCDSVRSSWDPNEKTVSPNGAVAAGTTLTYTIDFENLGNDTAFNIHVQDTLSQHLNANSFAMIKATHRVAPTVYEMGGKTIIKFDFVGINLEDKNVPTRNKGQVQFTIKVKNGVPAGTVIPNRAGIYFDGNPVVLTNYSYSNIPVPEGVGGVGKSEDIKVFPNPAANVLNIQVSNAGWDEAVLSNALGQIVARQSLHRGSNALNVASLPVGIYHLQVKGSAGSVSEKIEKQ